MGWREGGGDEWREIGRLVGEGGNEGCEVCCRQNNGVLKLPSLKARGMPLLLQRVHGIGREVASDKAVDVMVAHHVASCA